MTQVQALAAVARRPVPFHNAAKSGSNGVPDLAI